MSQVFRVRLSQPLEAQLLAFCATSGMPVSTVLRVALQYFLSHPMARVEVPLEDPRSPQQQESFARYAETLPDLEDIVAEMIE